MPDKPIKSKDFPPVGELKPSTLYPSFPILGTPPLEAAIQIRRTKMYPYMGDRFFPALSHFILKEQITDRQLALVSSYRIEKQNILSELRVRIEQIGMTEASARPAMFAEFASQQKARILALEAKEDEIRSELSADGKMFVNALKKSRRNPPGSINEQSMFYPGYREEMMAVIAFAYFQDGLNAPQRDLLRELSMDIVQRFAPNARPEIDFENRDSVFFLSPSPARLRLPREMPEQLRKTIIQYSDLKHSMKRELREMVAEHTHTSLATNRTKAAKELGARQATQFIELDRLAEEIRVGLAGLKLPDAPNEPALPASLAPQANSYLKAKADLNRTLGIRLLEIQAILPLDRVEIVPMKGAYGIEIIKTISSSEDQIAKRQEQTELLKAFNAEQIKRYQSLSVEREKLRLEIEAFIKSGSPELAGRNTEQVAGVLNQAFAREETWRAYEDYRIGVLQPGLSPEQRRLLFGSAIEVFMAGFTR